MGFLGKWVVRGVVALCAAVSCFLWDKEALALLDAVRKQAEPELCRVLVAKDIVIANHANHNKFAFSAHNPINEILRTRFAEGSTSANLAPGPNIAPRLSLLQIGEVKFGMDRTAATSGLYRRLNLVSWRLARISYDDIEPKSFPDSELAYTGTFDSNVGPYLLLPNISCDFCGLIRCMRGIPSGFKRNIQEPRSDDYSRYRNNSENGNRESPPSHYTLSYKVLLIPIIFIGSIWLGVWAIVNVSGKGVEYASNQPVIFWAWGLLGGAMTIAVLLIGALIIVTL